MAATRVMQPARATTTTTAPTRDPLFDVDHNSMNPYRLSGSSTLALAEFLASTGPEEFANRASMIHHHPSPNNSSNDDGKKQLSLFRKFRSSSNNRRQQASTSPPAPAPPAISSLSDIVVDHYHHRMPSTTRRKANTRLARSGSGHRLAAAASTTLAGAKHIPLLPASYEPMLRDSGVYSVGSTSSTHHSSSSEHHPKADTMQPCTSTNSTSPIQDDLQLFPMPPPSVPSPRMSTLSSCSKQQQKRHSIFKANVTTTTTRSSNKNDTCPHCRQHVTTMDVVERKRRRSSCPPALAGGFNMDGNKLLERIAQLEAMLMQERLSRKQLEDLVKQHLQQKDDASSNST